MTSLSADEGMRVPGDFLDELAAELETSRENLVREAERLSVLSELQRAANTATGRLGRPATLYDVIAAASDDMEQNRLVELARRLRDG